MTRRERIAIALHQRSARPRKPPRYVAVISLGDLKHWPASIFADIEAAAAAPSPFAALIPHSQAT